MPSTTKIEKYSVTYSANSFNRRIGLHSAGKVLGQLIFHPSGTSLPADGPVQGEIQLHYHVEDFANVLDLLRSEKPLYFFYNGTGGGFENGVKTLSPVVIAKKAAAAARPRRAR